MCVNVHVCVNVVNVICVMFVCTFVCKCTRKSVKNFSFIQFCSEYNLFGILISCPFV